MNILIIGNGFDIAHGLLTRYKDFLIICEGIKNNSIVKGHKIIYVVVDKDEEKNKIIKEMIEKMENVYDDFKRIVINNKWIDLLLSKKDVIGEDWIDIEEEIRVTLNLLYSYKDGTTKEVVERVVLNEKSLNIMCKDYMNSDRKITYRRLFEKLLEEKNKLIRALEIYMDAVNRIEIEINSYFLDKKIDKVLTFNYTDIFEKNYIGEVEYCYIHGKADASREEEKSNLVLGFDDHYFEDKQVRAELIPFEKYYQRIVKRTDNNYFKWLEDMDDQENMVYIYGHSLGASDGDVLKKFILKENTKVYIYYYDELDRATKIRNLAIILGPDTLIEKTGGNNPVIQFETSE